MAMLSGYMQRYTGVNTVGLCHSVQVCTDALLVDLDMRDKIPHRKELIAGINHMAWLLECKDKDGNDLYPEIRRRAGEALDKTFAGEATYGNLVRLEYIRNFGYYVTESSEHNAEYNMFYIKSKYPELIDKYQVPLDEYPRRCINQIAGWKEEYEKLKDGGVKEHNRSYEYGS